MPLILAGLLACAHLPPAPEGDWSWSVDREALPAATLDVYLIGTGEMAHGMAFQEGRGPSRTLQVYAFVLDHPTEGLVVIDPGYGRRTAEDPSEVPGRAVARWSGLAMGTPLVDRLGADYPGAPVAHLLATHMHVDHTGGIEDFPDATVHIDPAEWAFGTRKQLVKATAPPLNHEAIAVSPLGFGDGPCGPFARSEDVFGDGALIALSTPGHTPGHTAFLVNLPGGSVLLTGDAAWFDEHWEQPALKGGFPRRRVEVDWRGAADATWRIRDFQQRHPEVIVLSGHDPANIQRIEQAPTGSGLTLR